MLQVSETFKEAMVAPVRTFMAEADVRLESSEEGVVTTLSHDDLIKTIEIQRVGDNSKFFGFGICQRLNIHLVDLDGTNAPAADSNIRVRLGIELPDGTVEFISFPTFTITERNRAEEEGEISITAYDRLNLASTYKVADMELSPPYDIRFFLRRVARVLGLGFVAENMADDDMMLSLAYEDGANFDGTESLRDALNAAAEATQSIYYVDEQDRLHFKRLAVNEPAVATLTEDDYMVFHHKDNRRLANISHVTELGDNLTTNTYAIGTTQYIRNNPFWEMREDMAEILEQAMENVRGLVISQFDCEWRGNLPLEIGDKIEIKQLKSTKCIQPAYVFDDVISFDGGYGQKTQWIYSESDAETETNPTNIGDAINQTFAKVDKINKTIELVASETSQNTDKIAAIEINTESISNSVEQVQKDLEDSLDGINTELITLTERVNTSMTKDEFVIEVEKIKDNGTAKVETTTGFTFDENGLTIDKTGSEMTTTITEDGMSITKNGDVVLTADNEGVKAVNLHATTYLIIGENSRFEDYVKDGEARTGCFWVGGASAWQLVDM